MTPSLLESWVTVAAIEAVRFTSSELGGAVEMVTVGDGELHDESSTTIADAKAIRIDLRFIADLL
jgi:hypothetical protein